MKKSLMILASVALGASLASAVDVESKNIVGYGQATTGPGFWLVGCNFQSMTGSNAVSIQDLMPASELYADPGADPDGSDQIHVFNGSGYTIYFYLNAGEPGDPQWYDDVGAATVEFTRGDGFWYKRAVASTATNVTISGQVPMDASAPHDSLPEGFFVVANAYPNVTPFNDLGISSYADPGADPDGSDQIHYYNGSGYTIYFFLNAGEPGDPQWYDDVGPTEAGIPVGGAAWYKRAAGAGSATWTETKPY